MKVSSSRSSVSKKSHYIRSVFKGGRGPLHILYVEFKGSFSQARELVNGAKKGCLTFDGFIYVNVTRLEINQCVFLGRYRLLVVNEIDDWYLKPIFIYTKREKTSVKILKNTNANIQLSLNAFKYLFVEGTVILKKTSHL